MNIFWSLFLQFILILINAVFACAEIAVISINDAKLNKLNEQGNKKARRLVKLVERPANFLATIQVGITLAGFLGSAFAAGNFAALIVNWLLKMGVKVSPAALNTISIIVITLTLSYLSLVFGELVPKRVAMKNAEKIALFLSKFIYVMSKIFAPLVWLLTVSTNGILRLIGIDPYSNDRNITEEEIRMMVDEGSEKGAIDNREKEMIQNIFEFNDKTAEDIMTHRTDVTLLWLDEDMEQWQKTIIENRNTNYPVCDENTEDIIGVLNAKDFLRLKDKTRENTLKSLRPAYFVPKAVKADKLFSNMKKTHNHFAIVLDEYGGMDGIITMNDLLEELVGDLEDDKIFINEPELIEKVNETSWKIQGNTPLEEVSKQLKINLPDDEYDTFGGLVFGLLGFIPKDGDTPEINDLGLNIKVIKILDHQLISARVCLLNTPCNEDENKIENKIVTEKENENQ